MAEVTAFRNNALPYPIYGQPWAVVFPMLDADGDLVTGATTPDAEVSKNGDTFTDCTNESTEIATNSGVYYLLLTAAEMTADIVTVIAKSATAGMKTTVLTLYPRKLVSIRAGTSASAGSATSTIVLDASASAVDDFYNGMVVVAIIDGTTEVRMVTDYTGSTQTATVVPDWNTAPDNNDTFTIYRPDGVQIQQANASHWNSLATVALPLAPATAGRTLVVDSSGLADANMVKVGPSGSGTAQTARDLGNALPSAAPGAANGLITFGSSTGQMLTSNGLAFADIISIGQFAEAANKMLDFFLNMQHITVDDANFTPTTTEFQITDTVDDESLYMGRLLLGGASTFNVGYRRRVTGYFYDSGNSQVRLTTDAWPFTPVSTDDFLIAAEWLDPCFSNLVSILGSETAATKLSAIAQTAITGAIVDDAGNSTTVFLTDLTESEDDYYNGGVLTFVSGTNATQVRRILDYDGTSKAITVESAFDAIPMEVSEFIIIGRIEP